MTVVNPKSISGINSITMASGSDDLLTIHSNNTTERVRVNNSGDVIIGSGVTLSPDGDIFATGITTVSGNVKVGTGITLSPDGDGFFTGVVTATTFKGDGSQLSNVTSTTINANADNRVITGSDTANTLNGESNLTYDGSTLKINGGLIEIAHTSCHLDFMETSTTNHRLRNGSGNFQIQKISDDKNTTTTQFLVDGGTGAVELYHNGTKMCETSANGLSFVSGKGIDFSATGDGTGSGSVSELLDDYEEGTWTASTVTGSATFTGTIYTRIGRLVYFQGKAGDFTDRSSANSIVISGLPFTSSNGLDQVVGTVMYRYSSSIVYHSTYMTSGNQLQFYGGHSNDFVVMQHNNLTASSSFLYFNGTYQI